MILILLNFSTQVSECEFLEYIQGKNHQKKFHSKIKNHIGGFNLIWPMTSIKRLVTYSQYFKYYHLMCMFQYRYSTGGSCSFTRLVINWWWINCLYLSRSAAVVKAAWKVLYVYSQTEFEKLFYSVQNYNSYSNLKSKLWKGSSY